MERRGEHHQVESAAGRIPVFERRDFDGDPLGPRDGGHPGVGLDGKQVGAAFDQLHRGNPGSGAALEDAMRMRCEHVVDQLVGIARTKGVVVFCCTTK